MATYFYCCEHYIDNSLMHKFSGVVESNIVTNESDYCALRDLIFESYKNRTECHGDSNNNLILVCLSKLS